MILLLGASGYLGEAFVQALRNRGEDFMPVSRKQVDYTRFDTLLQFLREKTPDFLINAAGFTGKPNVDACEAAKADTLAGNTLLPVTIAQACVAANLPWGHVSSGCIFSGAKVVQEGKTRVEKDLTRPDLAEIVEKNPAAIQGYTETDAANFSFRDLPCSFYSGTKALAEEAISGLGRSYIWRLRIPFDEIDNPRNYLSKIQRYAKVYDNVNSISHRADFVNACLDLWKARAPFGTYNVTNPGFITTHQVVRMLEEILKPNRKFEYWRDDSEFYRVAAKTPRSNCVLDVSKLLAAGVKIRTVREALESSLRNWKAEKR
jgi:dTDP-4-dehydrorhamnose reductase